MWWSWQPSLFVPVPAHLTGSVGLSARTPEHAPGRAPPHRQSALDPCPALPICGSVESPRGRARTRLRSSSHSERTRTTMIRLSVYYPTTEGATFDHDYYREKHVPFVVNTWAANGAEIDKGIDGPYVAAVHFT